MFYLLRAVIHDYQVHEEEVGVESNLDLFIQNDRSGVKFELIVFC